MKVPEEIALVRQLPFTPELNPSERLWSLLKEAVTNRLFEKIEAMEDVLVDKIRTLSQKNEISPLLSGAFATSY